MEKISTLEIGIQAGNINIKQLKIEDNFDKFKRIATENDIDAMPFAFREKFVAVKNRNGRNVFFMAARNNRLRKRFVF